MSRLYNFSEYDKYLSLKVNAELWFVILYLLRPYIILIGTQKLGRGSGSAAGIEGVRNILYPDDFSMVLAILATIPVLLFMFSHGRKESPAQMR